jgi:hypothetical protein
LRCGRCGDLICPRCLVTSPVGARCENCARLGRPKILDTSSTELGRAILLGLAAAVGGSFALSLAIWIVVSLPFESGVVGLILVVGGFAGIGYVVGESVRYGSGKKIDRRLKYVTAGGVFVAWAMMIAILPLFNITPAIISSVAGVIGLLIAFYVAMNRVKF